MKAEVYEIRDRCRRNLNQYTIKAFSMIPPIDHPAILDMGCGTGESTMALLKRTDGHIVAVDADRSSLMRFREKVRAAGVGDRIEIIHGSALDTDILDSKFDIVLAEGVLHIIGFEEGLTVLLGHLKRDGYLFIHDGLDHDAEMRALFAKHTLTLMNSFVLDETVWWNDYYRCLEELIAGKDSSVFNVEIDEIAAYKRNPDRFCSICYILHKQQTGFQCGYHTDDF